MPSQKEKPIIFSSEMVRAILDDRKTQTRRVPVERYRNWKVGSTLWVRESFRPYTCGYDSKIKVPVEYRADKFCTKSDIKWKPSIHMPRWAARIFLEITGLRDEMVQDISESDIICEGCPEFTSLTGIDELYAARMWWWNELWDFINAKRHNGIYAWGKNPVVKVIEFKKIFK